MPRNPLDGAHELDESHESIRTNAASNEWLKGTSRDLLSTVKDMRAEPADVAKPSPAGSTNSPSDTATVADRDFPPDDSRDDALRDFHLGEVSDSVAEETGSELAQPTDADRREQTPIQERSAKSEEANESIAAQLDTHVPAPGADSTMASEFGNPVANSVDDNSELLASLRTTFNPALVAMQQELMQEVVDNADYKAKFVSGAAGLAGLHATELARSTVDLLRGDMAGAADGVMSAQEHISGLVEAVKMFRDGLEFPVTPDELRQREQAISELWKTLNPPPDKPRP